MPESAPVYLGITQEGYRRALARALWEVDGAGVTSETSAPPPTDTVFVLDLEWFHHLGEFVNPLRVILIASRNSFRQAWSAGVTRVIDPDAPLSTVVLSVHAMQQFPIPS